MLGEIYILYGLKTMMEYMTLGFAEYFKRADELLPAGSQIFRREFVLVGEASFVTTRDLGPGSAKRMIEALFEAMPHAVRVMHGCGAGLEYLAAAEADYMTGDMKGAERNAYAALYRAQPMNQFDIEYMASAILIRIAVFQGDYRRAAVVMESVDKRFKQFPAPDCGSLCDIAASRFYVPLGQCDKVAQLVAGDADMVKSIAPISRNRGRWVRARCLLQNGRYHELLGYLDQLDAHYKKRCALSGLIENAVMRAIAHHYTGDRVQALKAFHESYLLSYENDIIIHHVEFGKWTRTLIRAARAEKNCPIPNEWLDMIYTKATTYAKRLNVMTQAYEMSTGARNKRKVNFTRREKDVLMGLCQGLTREEIAQSYGISANAVKAIYPIIYDKLGATNSLDAVRIATSLGLMA